MMHPLLALFDPATDKALADISLILGGLLAAVYYGKEIFFSKGKEHVQISPQPLAIQLVEELHEQFASKKAFEELAKNNTERHSQIFNTINRVEREARETTEKKFAELNEERRRTLEKLGDQYTFIRENIAAINRELDIRSEK